MLAFVTLFSQTGLFATLSVSSFELCSRCIAKEVLVDLCMEFNLRCSGKPQTNQGCIVCWAAERINDVGVGSRFSRPALNAPITTQRFVYTAAGVAKLVRSLMPSGSQSCFLHDTPTSGVSFGVPRTCSVTPTGCRDLSVREGDRAQLRRTVYADSHWKLVDGQMMVSRDHMDHV
ncbi:hypothetical protein VTI74DRAFT_7258 [Chaetomium olivicolor]